MSYLNKIIFKGEETFPKDYLTIGGIDASSTNNNLKGIIYKDIKIASKYKKTKYVNISYTWADDYSACAGKAYVYFEGTEVDENATISIEEKEATHYEDGYKKYTATFTGKAFETQVKQTTIPCPGHNFNEPTYTWSTDGMTCTAKRTCKDDTYFEEEEGTMSYSEVAATYSSAGSKTATATFTNTAFSTQSNVYETTPKKTPQPFATATDQDIADMITAHYAGEIDVTNTWSVGDSRSITGTDGTTATWIIIGTKHDDLATPVNGITKAAVTIWKSNNWTSSVMNNSYSSYTYADYSTSVGRTNVRALKTNLSSNLQSLVKNVTKTTSYPTDTSNTAALKTSTENIFLLSSFERIGSMAATAGSLQDGNQYEYMVSLSLSTKTGILRTGIWYLKQACFTTNNSFSYVAGVACTSSESLAIACCL